METSWKVLSIRTGKRLPGLANRTVAGLPPAIRSVSTGGRSPALMENAMNPNSCTPNNGSPVKKAIMDPMV
ncbi:hypothetical protein D3C86_2059740 [compost metagenome]